MCHAPAFSQALMVPLKATTSAAAAIASDISSAAACHMEDFSHAPGEGGGPVAPKDTDEMNAGVHMMEYENACHTYIFISSCVYIYIYTYIYICMILCDRYSTRHYKHILQMVETCKCTHPSPRKSILPTPPTSNCPRKHHMALMAAL